MESESATAREADGARLRLSGERSSAPVRAPHGDRSVESHGKREPRRPSDAVLRLFLQKGSGGDNVALGEHLDRRQH